MAKKNTKSNNMGKTKRSTDSIIEDAIARQNTWMEQRRTFASRFFHSLNVFAKPSPKKSATVMAAENPTPSAVEQKNRSVWRAYWFPIVCALAVIFIAIWVVFVRTSVPTSVVVVPAVPEPVVQAIPREVAVPTFDIVRIDRSGAVVVAGRWLAHQNISIVINGKIVATERTDSRGEFVYAPTRALPAGNYTVSLIGANPDVESDDKVFLYVSPHGYKNSVSLLMTKDGSTLLQAPKLVDGDLVVTKIDYLDNGRIVVTGNALPRLRVSLTLNDRYLGFARVSDHKHFGLGADVDALVPGNEYELAVRLHDGDGRAVATVTHKFTMPQPTGDSDTFYTVRRGDCLWIIARNFLRRGVLFSIIAERNNIENPNLIFPKQILQIPVQE